MLVSFGGAEECPGVMVTSSMRSREPFSETETLQERIREGPPIFCSPDIIPQARRPICAVVW